MAVGHKVEVNNFSSLSFNVKGKFRAGLLSTASSITNFQRERSGWDYGSGEGPRVITR